MTDTAPAIPAAPVEGTAPNGDSADLTAQWANLMQAYTGAAAGKQPALSAGNAFVSGTLPLMPMAAGFAQVGHVPRWR